MCFEKKYIYIHIHITMYSYRYVTSSQEPSTSEEDPRDFRATVDMAPPGPPRENLRGHLKRRSKWQGPTH